MSDRLKQLYGFLSEQPNDPFLHYAIATELLKTGQIAEALGKFEDLTIQHPNYVGTYYHLGKTYEAAGRTDDALATYEKGMRVAEQEKDRHALSELQTAWKQAHGWDDDEEDDDE